MPASVHEDQDQSMVDVDAQQENGEVIEVGENRITIVCRTLYFKASEQLQKGKKSS